MATPDNMLCGTCLSLVFPKYDELPESYFRCMTCNLASCYDRSCSGKGNYFKMSYIERGLYECIRCKPPTRKPYKKKLKTGADPDAAGTTKKRKKLAVKPLVISDSSQIVLDSGTGPDALASGGSAPVATAQFTVPDEAALAFRRSYVTSHSPRSPATKRPNNDDTIESEYEDEGDGEDSFSDGTIGTDDSDNESEFVLRRPDMKNREEIDNYVVDSLFALQSIFTSKYKHVRKEQKNQRYITNKILGDAESMRLRITVLEKSNASLVATCAELTETVNKLVAKDEAREQRLAATEQTSQLLEQNTSKLQQKSTQLEVRNRSLEDYSRQTNLVIAGAHEFPTVEEAVKAVYDIASVIQLNITNTDIYACHTLPSRSGPPRLLVKFTSRLVKEIFAARMKAKILSTGALGWPGPSRVLRVTDHLSPATADLLAKTKRRLHWNHNGQFKYVWTKNGRILVKVADKTKIMEIRGEADIEKAVLFGIEVVNDLKARGIYEQPPPPQNVAPHSGASAQAGYAQAPMSVQEDTT